MEEDEKNGAERLKRTASNTQAQTVLSKDINPVQFTYNVLFCYCWDLINVISLLFYK